LFQYEGGVLEMFLTESQKHYYTAMKKLGRKKPQKVIKRPLNQFLAMFYDLSNSRRFEIAIFVLIFLNMLSMGIEHYDQNQVVFFVLEVSNAFFTTVFSLDFKSFERFGLFYSFIIISYMIVINMYIAIILENFNQAHQEEEIGIVEDDLEMFYIRWSK
ncbi:sodium channel protein 60E-like, partial [Diaphorina citri]|uniref:Sodium channel protein 60E-like n=1 Tax=Diaphorina citri TaxID=121845 RepID=A0A3Q0JLR1_DIACI